MRKTIDTPRYQQVMKAKRATIVTSSIIYSPPLI